MKMQSKCSARMSYHRSLVIIGVLLLGLPAISVARSGLQSEESAPPFKVQKCRIGCLEKYSTDDFTCLQGTECSLCWDQCATTQPEIDTSIRETWPLRTMELIRHGSLVSAEVAWSSAAASAGAAGPSKCLVTWEVFGGGLMGNLLTESDNVQLSLWPDSKYKVQVTCKNKHTKEMTRSLPLAIETSQAVTIEELSRTPESSFATDSSNTWEAQPAETQSDDLDKLEQEIRQNSILLNKLHQIDVENNKFMNEQMLKNRIPVDVEEGEQMEADDHQSQDGSLEAIQLSQWRTISRTFAEGEFDVVLGIVSAVLMFILVLLVFLVKCRSRVADQSAQEEKQQQFVEDAERGMLHRPEQVLRAVDMQTMQTMHV